MFVCSIFTWGLINVTHKHQRCGQKLYFGDGQWEEHHVWLWHAHGLHRRTSLSRFQLYFSRMLPLLCGHISMYAHLYILTSSAYFIIFHTVRECDTVLRRRHHLTLPSRPLWRPSVLHRNGTVVHVSYHPTHTVTNTGVLGLWCVGGLWRTYLYDPTHQSDLSHSPRGLPEHSGLWLSAIWS